MSLDLIKRVLPICNNRYSIDDFGNVYDLENNLVKIDDVNCKKVVKLDWYDGRKNYEVGFILILCFYSIGLPEHLWERIEVCYNDNDSTNVTLKNIYYRFKDGPLEIDGCSGYYYIPYFTRYGISRNGNIINIVTGKIKTWYITKPRPKKNITGGYYLTTVCNDKSNTRLLYRHRALGFTFLEYTSNPNKLIVNHLDGVPGNDELLNLEWTTYSDNTFHAYANGLHPNKTQAVLLKNLNTGTIDRYNSIADCCRAIGRKWDFVNGRLRTGQGKQYSDGLLFKLDDGSDWPELNNRIVNTRANYEIIARNVFTGECFIFENQLAAAYMTGVSHGSIWFHVSNECFAPINGFVFRDKESNLSKGWPEYSKWQLLLFKRYPNKPPYGVLVICNITGDEHFYYNVIEFAKSIGKSRSQAMLLARRGSSLDSSFSYTIIKSNK